MSKGNSPFYKKWWFWVIIVAVVFVGILISTSGESEPTQQFISLNETAILDGSEIMVSSVTRNFTPEYGTPADGKEYIEVAVNIKNKSNENISYNPYHWRIETSNGEVYDYSWVTGTNDLHSGELTANGERAGTIVFEVPKDDNNLKLHYKPNAWSDKEIIIDLKSQ